MLSIELESEPVSLTNGAARADQGSAASGIYRYAHAPIGVTGDGVDFTVMRQVAERLRRGQRGTVLVEKRWWNRQMADPDAGPQDPDKSAADPPAYTDFIDVHQIRQATDVEVFVGFGRFSMRRRAINRRRSISRGRSLPER